MSVLSVLSDVNLRLLVVGKTKWLADKRVYNSIDWSDDCSCGDESNLKLKVLFYAECFIYGGVIEWND